MRFIPLPAVVFFCLLGCFSMAVSQSPTIRVSHVVAPVNQLSISDLDFRHSTTPKWLFTINITVAGVPSLDVTMFIKAGFMLPDGSDYQEAVTIHTEQFTVVGTRSISNLDLDRTIRLKPGDEGYHLDVAARRRLEQSALPTGEIPAGRYNFEVVVTSGDSVTPGTDNFPIVLSNPTAVELLAPMDGDQFASQFPIFQWQYDGPSARLSVFEKLPGQASLEEAASGIPQFSTVTSTGSLQYPSSGARVLEPGKTYVWYVEGLSGATGGTTVGRKSALRSFTVASNSSQTLSSILDELARALPKYQSVFDDLKAQGFTSAGTLRLNGTAMSIQDLQQLLSKLRLNPDAVTSVELE